MYSSCSPSRFTGACHVVYQEITVPGIKKFQYQEINVSTAVEFILIIVQVIPVHHLTELRRSGHRCRSRGRKVIRVKVLFTRAW